jgi:hypothetical protein
MRGTNLGGALLLAAGLSVAAAAPGEAGVSADLNIRLGTRPAPVVVFEREPDVVLVPSTRVYYVGGLDYDLFRYGQFWYINDGGYWYRARNYRGPFGQIRFESVPRQVVYVPDRFHRHPMHPLGGPPGQMKRYENANEQGVTIIRNGQRPNDDGGPRRVYKSNGNGQGHGNEKNKGRGH